MTNGLLQEPALVFYQAVKLFPQYEYSLLDSTENAIGSVVALGDDGLKRASGSRFEVRDLHGEPVLSIDRSLRKFKRRFAVTQPGIGPVGEIVQENLRYRCGLMVDGERVGELNRQHWRRWEFGVVAEPGGEEVARITKSREGKNAFTIRNVIVRLEVAQPLPDPLAGLVVASALVTDMLLKSEETASG